MIRLAYTLLGLSTLLLTSCEKNITPDLNPGEPKVVIEGVVTNGPGPYTVRLTRSADYYQATQPQGVTGATVIITDSQNNRDTLRYVAEGRYQTRTLRGVAGRTYTLRATVGTATYTATSTLPALVPLDRLTSESQVFGKIVYANFTDPATTANYYRWVYQVNGVQQSGIFTANDRLFDGLRTRQALFSGPNTDNALETGDRVRVEMQSIDAPVFNYFFALSQVSGNGPNQVATPANPTTNVTGGALGYFSACSVSTDTLTIR